MSADLKPAIFVWLSSTMSGGDVVASAMAEDGTVLAGHVSSNVSFARRDMGLKPEVCRWKHEKYEAHYPNGFRLVDLLDCDDDALDAHAEFSAAYTRNQLAKAHVEAAAFAQERAS